jgi:hypothetical protein
VLAAVLVCARLKFSDFCVTGQLLVDYSATSAFGIMLGKSHDNVMALLVDSGNRLVVIPSEKGSQAKKHFRQRHYFLRRVCFRADADF